MKVEKMKQIFETEIPYNDLIKNGGIYLFYEDEEADISIGISYENDDDGKEVYVYNLFLGPDEYVGFDSVGINEDKEYIIREITDEFIQCAEKTQSLKNEWKLTDDSCLQYVKQNSDTEFSLIEMALCSHMTLQKYEVYEDTIDVQDYFDTKMDELLIILKTFTYESLDD
ncbi:MAG: hypothetical protein LBI03_05680, partial [Clostridiales bacterium]|nr:hypothetical protein [Clostridiales bacterium]